MPKLKPPLITSTPLHLTLCTIGTNGISGGKLFSWYSGSVLHSILFLVSGESLQQENSLYADRSQSFPTRERNSVHIATVLHFFLVLCLIRMLCRMLKDGSMAGKGTQTGIQKGTNTAHTTRYLAGLRGRPDNKMHVNTYTRPSVVTEGTNSIQTDLYKDKKVHVVRTYVK